MSFGFGVGDFIVVVTLANNLRKRFVDAPKQLRAISDGCVQSVTVANSVDIRNRVKAFSNTIRDLEDISSNRELSESQRACLEDHLTQCQKVLQDLNTVLDKYQGSSSDPGSIRIRARTVWKRLTYEPAEVVEIRSRLISSIGLLHTFYASLTNKDLETIQHGMSQLTTHQDEVERRSVLGWLTSAHFADQQADLVSKRQPGTGQWLIDSATYQAWLREEQPTLFCPGIPGAGKTMITCAVIENIQVTFADDITVGICYIYCNYKSSSDQTLEYFLSSMVEQLAWNMLPLPSSLQDLYQRHSSVRTRPSVADWIAILEVLMESLAKTFVIVDGLDECSASLYTELLEKLFELQSTSKVKLFATSRHIPEITQRFDKEYWLEIRASAHDIRLYLEKRVKSLAACVQAKQQEICETMLDSIDGMFLLAKLWLDSLVDVRKPIQVREALASWKRHELATSIETLNEAYLGAVNRILSRTGSRDFAKQIFSWVTHAEKPPTVTELQHAIAFQDDPHYSEDDLTDIDSILAVCSGLLAVDEEAGIVRFIHYTTQEFFWTISKFLFGEGITDTAKTCVAYLSMDVFKSGACETEKEAEERLRKYPILNYAACNWGMYATLGPMDTWESQALKFLSDGGKVSNALQAMGRAPRAPNFAFRRATGVHLGAFFGLEFLVNSLLEHGARPDERDDDGRTPLSWAAYEKHTAVAKLLLAQDDVDPNSKDNQNLSPLNWVMLGPDPGGPIARLILQRFSYGIDSIDDWGIESAVTYYEDDGSIAYPILILVRDQFPGRRKPQTDQQLESEQVGVRSLDDERERERKEREGGMMIALLRLAYGETRVWLRDLIP